MDAENEYLDRVIGHMPGAQVKRRLDDLHYGAQAIVTFPHDGGERITAVVSVDCFGTPRGRIRLSMCLPHSRRGDEAVNYPAGGIDLPEASASTTSRNPAAVAADLMRRCIDAGRDAWVEACRRRDEADAYYAAAATIKEEMTAAIAALPEAAHLSVRLQSVSPGCVRLVLGVTPDAARAIFAAMAEAYRDKAPS